MIKLFNELDLKKAKTRNLLPLECLVCGDTFYRTKKKILAKKVGENHCCFCNKTCSDKHKIKIKEFSCAECCTIVNRPPSGLIGITNIFCSHVCAATFNNRKQAQIKSYFKIRTTVHLKLPGVIKMCVACGTKLLPTQNRTCSKQCTYVYRGRLQLLTDSLSTVAAKRHLIALRGNKCSLCDISSWREEPITIELDHIDGNSYNNKLENLRLLCPNCHSQTDTYRAKNKGKGRVARRKRYHKMKKTMDPEERIELSTSRFKDDSCYQITLE
jgi:hypothetical protein